VWGKNGKTIFMFDVEVDVRRLTCDKQTKKTESNVKTEMSEMLAFLYFFSVREKGTMHVVGRNVTEFFYLE
jgi:hypothetical protein